MIFGFCSVISEEAPNSIDRATNMPSPRIIKSHLPIHLLPKQLWTIKPKIIYVTRDCKDTMVSYYHFHSFLGSFKGTLDEYVIAMMKNKIRSSPLGINSLEFWQLRNMAYIFFTSFEHMKTDLRLVISKVSEFLQNDVNEDQMVKLLDHLSFGKMKENLRCNHINEARKIQNYFGLELNQNSSRFVRKGEINSYKTELSEEVKKELENWNNKQMEAYGITAEEMLWS
ncbi:sulfotransferase 1 family member D1-like [Eupeodes corollae]|uniref:sulfotransferase 1 family member D1-like n=1 Tax=Eupeodes corollae TaxID=290404 RepID=UPI002492C6F6|nr:sulfotransferase 1 family member D1-like [Eupeodes corollae]